MKKSILTFIISCMCLLINAQTDSTGNMMEKLDPNVYDLSLEELMNIEVSISSLSRGTNIQKAPSIISVVTRDEIISSGARDLIDVLYLVPGYNFTFDVSGAVMLGGNWAQAVKYLFMIDGQVMNELAYSTVAFGNHIPVEDIQRIEIIRGPGASLYGGFAELSVINIITRKGKDIKGVEVGVAAGMTDNTLDYRQNVYVKAGEEFKNLDIAFFGKLGKGMRSDNTFTYMGDGSEYDMSENTLDPTFLNLKADYKGLSFVAIYDEYKSKVRTGFLPVEEAFSNDFRSILGELKYKYQVNNKITITPILSYKNDRPWYVENINDKSYQRLYGDLLVSYDTDNYGITFGTQYYSDKSEDNLDDPNSVFWNGKKEINYNNFSVFAQGLYSTKWLDFTAGLRYEKHNQYGGAVVPRFALTSELGKVHAKLMYSKAFKSPSHEQINASVLSGGINPEPEIEPEYVDVFAAEIGYEFSKLYLGLNLYHVKTEDGITYTIDADNNEGYVNSESTFGHKGIETELKYKDSWGMINASYSFYTTKGFNREEALQPPDDNSVYLGNPKHKLTCLANIKLIDDFIIGPSLIYLGKQWAYERAEFDPNAGDFILLPPTELEATLLLNINFLYKNIGIKGLNAGLSVHNILNENHVFPQAYPGYRSPLPGHAREYIIKVTYNF